MPYTESFRAQMIKRMLGPPALSAHALSKKVGVPQPTLSKWLRDAGNLPNVTAPTENQPVPATPKKWTIEEKLRVLMEARGLKGSQLGALLRREGLHEEQLQSWMDAAAGALNSAEAAPSGPATAAERRKLKAANKRVRELEKELRRKDKALAEAAAMLMLEKKLQALGWDDGDDGTDGKSER